MLTEGRKGSDHIMPGTCALLLTGLAACKGVPPDAHTLHTVSPGA